MEFKDFAKDYIFQLHMLMNKIDLNSLNNFYKILLNASENATIYIMGNGGSSTTASHMANDLAVGLKIREIKNLKVISLSDNSAISYAISNDIGFENVFYMQLKDILSPSDIIIAISCSGSSANIVKATKYAKGQGCQIVGLTGFDGGELKSLSDISLHFETKKGEYGLVEDAHSIINHLIFSYFKVRE
jgi:D-sedoheptulose 7-phosphate isomerase